MGIWARPSYIKAKELIKSESNILKTHAMKTDSSGEKVFFNLAHQVVNEYATFFLFDDSVSKRTAQSVQTIQAKAFVLCITKACAHYITFFSNSINQSLNSYITDIHKAIESLLCVTKDNRVMINVLTLHCNDEFSRYSYYVAEMIEKFVLCDTHGLTSVDVNKVFLVLRNSIESELEKISDITIKPKEKDYCIKFQIALNKDNEQGVILIPKDDARNPREYTRLWAHYYTKIACNFEIGSPEPKDFLFLNMDMVLEDGLYPGKDCFDCVPIPIKYKPFKNIAEPYFFSGGYYKNSDLRTIETYFPDGKQVEYTDVIMSTITLLQFVLNRCGNNKEDLLFLNEMAQELHAILKSAEVIEFEDITAYPYIAYQAVCEKMGIIDPETVLAEKHRKIYESLKKGNL